MAGTSCVTINCFTGVRYLGTVFWLLGRRDRFKEKQIQWHGCKTNVILPSKETSIYCQATFLIEFRVNRVCCYWNHTFSCPRKRSIRFRLKTIFKHFTIAIRGGHRGVTAAPFSRKKGRTPSRAKYENDMPYFIR